MPKFFLEQYNKIKQIGEREDAPVNTMGIQFMIDETLDKSLNKFQFLVALILSAQTKDVRVSKAVKKLTDYGLTVDNIVEIPVEKLVELIFGVAFHNNKAKYIKSVLIIFF